jgi:CelD/BcsL family acetyltransferase involved in cellulose biosynthesis
MEEKSDGFETTDNGSSVEILDPLQRSDWDLQVGAFDACTVFHSADWARVLTETYGHTPMYFCRFEGKRLMAVLPFMEVSSQWTGRRGVSLPFTDACPALFSENSRVSELYQEAMRRGRHRGWKYMEARDNSCSWEGASPSLEFYGHQVNLKAGGGRLFKGLESAVRRGVRKAEAAGVKVEFESDPESVRTYYRLHCRTRRRHGLPPQPFRFFQNIQRHILGAGKGFIAIARLGNQPLGAGVFFYYGQGALYKFGASDYRFQQYRPNNLVMWAAMKRCTEQGLATLNLGRTSLSNAGLRRFKLGLGAQEMKVQYCKYSFLSDQFVADTDRVRGWFNSIFGRMPLPLLRLAGAVLYPHLA